MKKLKTWASKSYFQYDGCVANGTTIQYGNEFKFIAEVTIKQYEDLINKFRGKEVSVGTSRTTPPLGSLGEWLLENVNQTALASYIGAILVSERYAIMNKDKISFL